MSRIFSDYEDGKQASVIVCNAEAPKAFQNAHPDAFVKPKDEV